MPIARVLHDLGAGRTQKGQRINPRVGAELLLSAGKRVSKGNGRGRANARDASDQGRRQRCPEKGAHGAAEAAPSPNLEEEEEDGSLVLSVLGDFLPDFS